jgi:hypothetical protein
MAQVEFTQQFNVAYTSGGDFYVQLQATAGKYIVKGLTCYSTADLAPVAAQSLSIISASNSSGAGLEYLFSTNASIVANTIIPVFSPTDQVILNQSYIGFLPIGSSPGNMIIQISYSFIPNSVAVSSNFGNLYTNVTNAIGATFSPSSSVIPTVIKSIVITNPTNIGSATITPLLTTATTTNLAFDSSSVLAPGQSLIYKLPLYLVSGQSISIQSAGLLSTVPTIRVLYSYTEDPTSY